MSGDAITVVRLPTPPDANPQERILSVIGRTNLTLADELHAALPADGSQSRPYSVAPRLGGFDVVCFADRIAEAVLRGEDTAKLVTRVRACDLLTAGCPGVEARLAVMTPAYWRVAGLDHNVPAPAVLLGQLRQRWEVLGWPALPPVNAARVAGWIERMAVRSVRVSGRSQAGFTGVVKLDVRGVGDLRDGEREAVWALLRFAEYRGIGRNTTSGLGRVRLLHPDERWEPGTVRHRWETN